VEPRYNEGPRDEQNVFVLTEVRFVGVFYTVHDEAYRLTFPFFTILVPRAAILLASATDRELWRGPG